MSCWACRYEVDEDYGHTCSKATKYSKTPEGACDFTRVDTVDALKHFRKKHKGVCPYFKKRFLLSNDAWKHVFVAVLAVVAGLVLIFSCKRGC